MFCNNSATFKLDLTDLILERLCRDKKKYEEAFKVFSSFFFSLFLCYAICLEYWLQGKSARFNRLNKRFHTDRSPEVETDIKCQPSCQPMEL